MDSPSLSAIIDYGLIPLLIFAARMSDVSLATIRFLLISRAHRLAAASVGFVETVIWLIAVTRILQNLNNPLYYIAYAGGFATGTFVGMWVEEKLAMGVVLVRIITPKDAHLLIDRLKGQGYGLTAVQGQGSAGPVHVIFSLVKRRNAGELFRLIRDFDPNTFYTVENVRSVRDPLPPLIQRPTLSRRRWLSLKRR